MINLNCTVCESSTNYPLLQCAALNYQHTPPVLQSVVLLVASQQGQASQTSFQEKTTPNHCTFSSFRTQQLLCAFALDSLGNYTKAILYLDKVLAIDPNDKFALYNKGASLNNLGNYTQAIPYLDKALAIDPNFKEALNGKGNALYGLGNYAQALQYYEKALAIDPNNKVFLNNKENALLKLGKGL